MCSKTCFVNPAQIDHKFLDLFGQLVANGYVAYMPCWRIQLLNFAWYRLINHQEGIIQFCHAGDRQIDQVRTAKPGVWAVTCKPEP